MDYQELIKKSKKELKEIAATVFLTVKSEWNKEIIVNRILANQANARGYKILSGN